MEEARGDPERTEDENQQWGGVGEHAFAFDTVFWTGSKQEEVFDVACRPQVEHVLQGYNACAFAYGQTGSGKTYTMFGEPGAVRGAIPRAVEHLFDRVDAIRQGGPKAVALSFLERSAPRPRPRRGVPRGEGQAERAQRRRRARLPTGSGSRPPSPKSGGARRRRAQHDQTHQYAGSSGEENRASRARARGRRRAPSSPSAGACLSLSLSRGYEAWVRPRPLFAEMHAVRATASRPARQLERRRDRARRRVRLAQPPTLGSRGAAASGMGEQMGAARLVDIGYARMEPHERAVGASGTKLKPPPPLLSLRLKVTDELRDPRGRDGTCT